ncbi:NKAP family protein UM04995-like [Asterias rubens]|uniref:NKAP family protein UM04995-like n=1 Tax=Asterias rubens TaxID=7604 RepID=UPI001455635D|nr:NKAP family protein UM04995-like [Asterias rubens]
MALEVTMADATQPVVVDSTTCEVTSQQEELERLAVEELVNEAKRAKERSQTLGSYAWAKRKVTTNKRFLHNTLVSTLREYRTDTRPHRRSFTKDDRVGQRSSASSVDANVTTLPDLPSTTLDEKKNNSETTSRAALLDQDKRGSHALKDDNLDLKKNNTERTSRAALLERETSGRHALKDDNLELNSRGMSKELGRPRNYHDHHSSERKGKHLKSRRSSSPSSDKTDRHRSKSSKHKKKHKREDRHSGTASHRKSKKHKRSSRRSPNI